MKKKLTTAILLATIVLTCFLSMGGCVSMFDFDGEFVRTDRFFDWQSEIVGETSTFLIKSTDQLQEFLDKIPGEQIVLEQTTNLFFEYDEAFFETNNLILVGISESSGSNRHKLLGIFVEEDTVFVNIKRIVPQVGTCDMAYWHLFLTISKSAFDGAVVKVNLTK